jgi:hypothetical protein
MGNIEKTIVQGLGFGNGTILKRAAIGNVKENI